MKNSWIPGDRWDETALSRSCSSSSKVNGTASPSTVTVISRASSSSPPFSGLKRVEMDQFLADSPEVVISELYPMFWISHSPNPFSSTGGMMPGPRTLTQAKGAARSSRTVTTMSKRCAPGYIEKGPVGPYSFSLLTRYLTFSSLPTSSSSASVVI